MFFLKKDEEDERAIDLINHCLRAHTELRENKEKHLAELYYLYEAVKAELTEILQQEDEIKIIEYQISGIKYALDYVRLMLNFKKQ